MIILGIDPGLSVTGYAIMKKELQKIEVLDYGAVTFSNKSSLEQRIGLFYTTFHEKIIQAQVTTIALETPFLGKNPHNYLKLGYLRGIVHLLADQHSISLEEFAPSTIKRAVTGSGAAQKEQVARVITRLFKGIKTPKTYDVTDALAVTLCGIWKNPITRTTR
jgi:crossover junction endodeoxyribonuclease RuvC